MKTELIVKFRFIASHSLAGHETPHPHIWSLELVIEGTPIAGKIVDIVQLRNQVQHLIQPLENQYLNHFKGVTQAVREFPTCETLSVYFLEKLESLLDGVFLNENPSIHLNSVLVALREMDGTEMGAVRLKKEKSRIE